MIRNAAEFRFSWSHRCRMTWNECRRKYFLHYYAARGGHDETASGAIRELHLLRSLLPAETYRRRLFAQELRRAFYESHEEENPEYPDTPPPLTGALLNRFRREFRRMMLGEFRGDHALPMLQELYYNTISPGELEREISASLRHSSELLRSGVFAMLFKTRYLHRRPIETPLKIQLAELSCYTAPILATGERGGLTIIEASGNESTALLHKLYADQTLHIPPERVRSLILDIETGTLREPDTELNISRAIRDIRESAAEMLDAIRPGGTIHEEDFPAEQAHCPFCRFRKYCN